MLSFYFSQAAWFRGVLKKHWGGKELFVERNYEKMKPALLVRRGIIDVGVVRKCVCLCFLVGCFIGLSQSPRDVAFGLGQGEGQRSAGDFLEGHY